jgi:hypothetical protein
MRIPAGSLLIMASVACAGCVTRPPSIAHVHLGHALTAVHVTPNREGYLTIAQDRAREANEYMLQAAEPGAELADIKVRIAAVVDATSSEDNFGLKQSLVLAANHISFAATSDDASANVREGAPLFAKDISGIVERCELIALLGKDLAATESKQEAAVLVEEISKLTLANVQGDDADKDGRTGATPAEYGVQQVRQQFDAMIARENPRYQAVDQWYLFNLVRLPGGRWVFDKLNRGGTIEGYK